MDNLSWEEKYLRLRLEKDTLAKKATDQDRAILQMKTKFAKLESLFKQKQKADGVAGGGIDLGGGEVVGGRRTDRDNEQLVTDLYKRNAKLGRDNKVLEEKAKTMALTIGKLKRELQLARRRGGTTSASKRGNDDNDQSLTDITHTTSNTAGNTKLAELVDKLRHRLINAEKQLGKLREENTRLRGGKPSGGVNDQMDSTMAAGRSAAWVSSTAEGEEILRLQRELRDTAAKLQLLQTRYDHMDSKAKAQNELQQGSFEQLEEYNRKIRDLRLKLQEAQHDKDVANSRASRAEEFEEEVRMLQEQNAFLEDKVTRLCEAPFMDGTSVRHVATDFDRQKSQHKQQIEKLQEVASTHHAALQAIQKEADLLRKEKEQLQKQIDRNGASNQENDYARQASRDKNNLFGSMSDLQDLGMEDIDMRELERALAIVRRKMDDPTDLDFLQRVDDEDLTTVPDLKKRLQMVQVTNLSITRELERAERMLKAQASINRDLHLELEESHKRARTEKDALQAKLEDFESLCLKRLQRIHSLEAQIRQHLYSVGSSGGGKSRKTPAALNDVVGLLDSEDNLLQEIASGDFGPDENLVEVYVIDAEISESIISSTSSTFILVDFFDYESQATPLVTGLYPRYDFATTYKVTVDDFFLRFLATDSLTIEMNKAHNADYQLLAKASVTLASLLESSPKILLARLPLISVKDGSIAGYLHMEVRMALPVTELYRLFLDRHPEERSRIESITRQNLRSEMVLAPDGTAREIKAATASVLGPREEARLSNEISVIVKSGANLSKSSKHSPSTYVHYQLLGFQDVFTNVVDLNSDPNYNHTSSFPIITDPKLLRFLKNYKLQFAVFEDSKDGDDGDNMLIGECKVSLAALAVGEDIMVTATLYNSNRHEVGSLDIQIKWNSPLKRPADAGPNALTAPEIEELMSRFGPQRDGQVNYVDFVRFANPSPAVRAALENFTRFLQGARKEQGITTTEFFEALCESNGSVNPSNKANVIDSEGFVSGLMTMEFGLPPDEIAAVFSHIDIKGENKVSIKEFLLFAEPPASSATSIITEKLRLRCEQMHRMGTPVMLPFQRADASNSGKVTRLQFKDCLREMGFILVDDDFVQEEDIAHSTIQKKKVFGDDIDDDGDEIIGVEIGGSGIVHATNSLFEKSRAGSSSNAAAAENEMKRIEFDKRVKELTQQNNAATASIDFDLHRDDNSDDEESDKQRLSQTMPAQNKKPPISRGAKPPSGVQQAYDTPMRPDMAATVTGIAHSSVDTDSKERADEAADHNDSMNIVDVEVMLNDCCKIYKGTKILPEGLKGKLKDADDTNEGYLTKRKFASVITANEHMHSLSPIALESVMGFFQKSKSGSLIDYRAFLTFMGAKRPAVSNGSSLMAKMVMHHESAMDEFAKYDTEGSGYVKRADFYDTVRGLGFNYLSSSDMDDIAVLFEFGNRKGEVYYSAFVEYVCQQEAALELKDVEGKVRRFIKSSAIGSDQNAFREVFAKFDSEGKGVVSAAEFGKGLDSLGLSLARSDMEKLFMRADPRGEGVSYKDFVTFIMDSSQSDLNEPDKMSSDYDMGLIQLKCFAVATEYGGRHSDLRGLGDSFLHYDWRRTGKLPLRCFAAAVRSAGFTLSRAEIVVLAQNFGEGGVVPYNDFLNWCAPDGQNVHPVIGGNVSLETLMAKLRSLAARSENGSYSKWANVFEAADVDGSGIIEEDKCRQSFRTLGVKISEAECRALSVEFGAGKKTAVRYRALLRVLFPGSGVDGDGKGINALRRLQSSANRCDMDLSEIARKAREIFAELDLDGIGYCTTRSFKKGLIKLVNKVKLAAPSDNDVEELLERYDTHGDGSVGWKEFISESFAGGGVGAGEEMEAISRFKVMIKRCIRKGVDYRAAFERLDEGFKGSLSSVDFKSALQELGGGLTEGEINALAGKFRVPGTARGENADRTVLYIELLHSLVPAREVEWEEVDGWRIEEKLRSMIKNRFEFWVPGKLNKAFKFFDRPTPNGKINVDQLADGLKRLKAFRLSSSQEQRLFEIMDMGGSGHVTYNDFVVFVRDANFSDVSNKLIGDLQKNSVKSGEVKKVLEKAASGNALLGIKEFKGCMDGLGVTLSKSDCMRLSNWMFVDEENNNISVKQLVDFVKRDGKREDGAGDDGFLSDDASDDSDVASDDESDKSKKGAKLLRKLKERLQKAENKGIGGKSSFSYFDKNSNGEIDEKELVAGYKQLLKIALTKKESKDLMEAFKGKKIGRIRLKEFLKALDLDEENKSGDEESESDDDNKKPRAKTSARSKSRERSKNRDSDDDASEDESEMSPSEMKKMIQKAAKKAKRGGSSLNYKRVFGRLDVLDDGFVSKKEFKKACEELGFDFSDDDMKAMMKKFDKKNDGKVKYKLFEKLAKLESDDEDDEKKDVDDLALMVRKELKRVTEHSGNDGPKVMKAFDRADKSGDGELSSKEFKRCIRNLGFAFKVNEEDDLINYLDTDGDGHISYSEFMNLLGVKKIKKTKVDSDSDNDSDDDDAYNQLMEKLCSAIEKGRDVLAAFEFFDRSGSGEISEDQFKEGLEKLRVKGNGKAVKRAFNKFKGRRAGKIVFKDFVKAVEKKSIGGSSKKRKGGRRTYDDDDAISKKLKKELKRLTKSNSGPPRMRSVFEEIDENGNGAVDESELKRAMQQMGFEFDRQDIKDIMNKFDENGRGEIVFEDFVNFFQGDADSDEDSEGGSSEIEVDEIFENLRKEFKRITKSRSGPPRIRAVFEEIDSNGDGIVNKREFRRALDEMGFRFSESQIKKLIKKIDFDEDGGCSYEEFEALCEGRNKKGKKAKADLSAVDSTIVRKLKRSEVVTDGELMDEFEKLEKEYTGNTKGSMRVKDFEKAVKSSFDGVRLSRNDIKEIVEACDPNETGKVQYEKFVNALEK